MATEVLEGNQFQIGERKADCPPFTILAIAQEAALWLSA